MKIPQSTLGYAVNGQLVFMPPQRRQSSPGTHQRNALKNQKKRRGDRKDPVKSSGSMHRYYQLRFHPGMEALKNASRVGDLQGAYNAILNGIWNNDPPSNALWSTNSRIDYSYRLISQLKSGGVYPYSMAEFISIVHILTAPHVENRSAIYYAAHCGQSDLVRNYLGLLVLCRLAGRNRIKKNTRTLALTFEGWFEYLGYPSGFFNTEALRLCVLNSLNEETKRVFQSNTYTVATILASTRNIIGKAWPFDAESLGNGMVVASKSPKAKTKTPRPVLRFYDLSREDPHLLLVSDDEESDWEEDEEVVEKDTFLGDYDAIIDGLVMVADEELSPLIDGQDDQIEETINSEADTDSSWSVEILNMQERENIDESSTDWSMLSEVSSVVTFESSMIRSFKDALVSNAGTSNLISPAERAQPYSNRPKLAVIQENKAPNGKSSDDEDDGFDPYFMMDGVKGARGGRSARMFKGNSRTGLNWPRRHRHKREETPRAHISKRMV